ncbi:DUF6200 domain-containing protein [Aetokthonos hydrillicola]|uniref:DUF6200 domain-containing protein n=1 Tax=Aetokthonos hydrillicola TaxID=1550245 RepID=UPI001ABA1B87|nr:hypothetical protein [Aetokthonos hydrillicola]MBO3463255.1 hypothetical protein [Aetokthonos hydrillicola CCALA 1050]
MAAGTSAGGAQKEADRWNTFLLVFGLKFLGEYNGISGNQTVNSSHPIFAGVKAIYQNNGNSIVNLDSTSQTTQLVLTHSSGKGLTAVFAPLSVKTQESKPKKDKGKKVKKKEGKRKKADTIILEFGSHKKDHIRDFAQGKGRLLKKVKRAISYMYKSGEIDRGVQPVIAIIVQKKSSTKTIWD